jgi:putative DNA primase/helicase
MNKASPEDVFEARGGRRENFSSKKAKAQNGGNAGAGGEDELILDPSNPLQTAKVFVVWLYMKGTARTLQHHGHVFFRWNGCCYEELPEDTIRSQVFHFLGKAKRWQENTKGALTLADFKPNSHRVSNVVDALRAETNLDASLQPPVWLAGAPTDAPPANEILCFPNGLLHLPAMRLLPTTPLFFSVNAVEFPYDPSAPEPIEWKRFMLSLWADDSEVISTLLELIGYFLLPATDQQKLFLIVGVKRSGKGTIARIIKHLLGSRNVCAPTLASLGQQFGLAPLIGKQLAIIPDARLSGRVDQQAIAERLLSISGEDALTIDRKFLPAWTGTLSTKIILLTNILPNLGDVSGALASRFIILVTEKSFFGREDLGLLQRLLPELPGIMNLAIAGWHRLRERGHFIQPASSIQALEDLENLTNPTGAFLREVCEIGPGRQVECSLLFCYWRAWAEKQNRQHVGTVQAFGVNIRAGMPGLRISQPRQEGGRARCYEGIALKPDLDPSLRVIAEALHDAEDKGAEEKTRRWK